jgi:hypothetical protein
MVTEEYDDEGRLTRAEHESLHVTVKLAGVDGVGRTVA